ncbi:serine proteinase stubble-like [Tropilaelaps mercedesae]|uniref:Serine proteinase stubble-like n=1 Tax=Tropilaelaps mercedesae TaxID=418985 RepID=A0A1V9XUB0_9ACAR|nr:serine proteinase stubble-like [Tropilaelaps mercedesae]
MMRSDRTSVVCVITITILSLSFLTSFALEVRIPKITKSTKVRTGSFVQNTTASSAESAPKDSKSKQRKSQTIEDNYNTTVPLLQSNVTMATTIEMSSTPSSAGNGQTSASISTPPHDPVLDVTKRDTAAVVTELPQTTSRFLKTTVESMAFNVNEFNSDLKCGRRPLHQKTRNRIKRIVGGSSATEGEWPWQVIVKEVKYLGTIADYKCGGVLISERHVLTAAHCKPRAFLSTLVAILGQHRLHDKVCSLDNQFLCVFQVACNLMQKCIACQRLLIDAFIIMSNVQQDLQTIPVTRMIVHKNFNEADFDNDLAVLELKFPVDFSDKIVPICLPDLDENFVGQNGFVTGWGKLAHKGGLPKVLQNVKLPIISREKCQQMFMKSGHVKNIHEYFLCAGYDEGKLDACEGDSGGPLSVQRPNGQWVLAGTVSHGIRCAEPNLPGVYMNISYYRPWIERMMALPRMLRSASPFMF